jgi:hypothetical protein
MVELNTIVSLSSNLYVTMGLTTNDRGEIAADALLPNGDQHAVLLIPCHENHPNVEGCDYSLTDGNVNASKASSTATPEKLCVAGCRRGVGGRLTLKARSRRDKLFDAWSEKA